MGNCCGLRTSVNDTAKTIVPSTFEFTVLVRHEPDLFSTREGGTGVLKSLKVMNQERFRPVSTVAFREEVAMHPVPNFDKSRINTEYAKNEVIPGKWFCENWQMDLDLAQMWIDEEEKKKEKRKQKGKK